MKKILSSLLVAVVGVSLAFPITGSAQDEQGRWFLKADAGGNWTEDTEITEFFGQSLPPGAKVKFDPGLRLGFAGGYNFTDWFAMEAELGIMANSIDSITGARRVEADFANVPLLLNAKLKYPNQTPFTPYIGGGVGFSTSILDVEDLQIGSTYMSGSEADVVFAYQAFAGVRYNLNENMSLGLEYPLFSGPKARIWEAEVVIGTFSDTVSFGRTDTHSISLTFQFAF